jgi:hypothetical protein
MKMMRYWRSPRLLRIALRCSAPPPPQESKYLRGDPSNSPAWAAPPLPPLGAGNLISSVAIGSCLVPVFSSAPGGPARGMCTSYEKGPLFHRTWVAPWRPRKDLV